MVQSTDARISAAHTQRGHARTYAFTYVRVAGGAMRTCSDAYTRYVRTIIMRGRDTHTYIIRMRVTSTHCLHVDSITTRVGTCTLHHVYVYVRVRMVSASVKHALAATVLA